MDAKTERAQGEHQGPLETLLNAAKFNVHEPISVASAVRSDSRASKSEMMGSATRPAKVPSFHDQRLKPVCRAGQGNLWLRFIVEAGDAAGFLTHQFLKVRWSEHLCIDSERQKPAD